MVFPQFIWLLFFLIPPSVNAEITTNYNHQLEQKISDLDVLTKLQAKKISDLEIQSQALETKHANVLASILSKLQSQEQELDQLKTELENTTETDNSSKDPQLVVFQARTSLRLTHTSRIHFQQVTRNIGGGFSSSTGVFTAPKTGTYQIWYNIQLGLVPKNNNPVLTLTGGEGATFDSSYVPAIGSSDGRRKHLQEILALSLVKDDPVYLTLNPPALVEANSSFGGVFLGDL